MTESQQGQSTSELPSRREVRFDFLEPAPATHSPSKPQHLPILSGTAKIVSLLTIAIVVGAFVLTKSGRSFFERLAVSQTGQSEVAITRPLEYTEAERGEAFAAFRQASGHQNKLDAILALAEAGDHEAMLEVSIALEELGRLSDAAAWDRRLSETGAINGVGRYAMKVLRGQVPGIGPAQGAEVLSAAWETKGNFIDGEFVYQKLDPRVAAEAGRLYATGYGTVLRRDVRRASEFLYLAAKEGLKAAERDWVILCAQFYSPYNQLTCIGFVSQLNTMSDDGSGEILFHQARALEEGWKEKPDLINAKRRYGEARAKGHVGAAARLLELKEPVIRNDAAWNKIYQKALDGDKDAQRYVGLSCARDTELSGPNYACVLQMFTPLTDETGLSERLEVCLAYEAIGQSENAASCEYQLAANGSNDGKALYAVRLVTGEAITADPLRGLKVIDDLTSFGLDPRVMVRLGNFYLDEPIAFDEWDAHAYSAAYWFDAAKDQVTNGWLDWFRACDAYYGSKQAGAGRCKGFEEYREEYESVSRSVRIASAYGSDGAKAKPDTERRSPADDSRSAVDQEQSIRRVTSSDAPRNVQTGKLNPDEIELLRRKWEIINASRAGRAGDASTVRAVSTPSSLTPSAGRVEMMSPEEIAEFKLKLQQQKDK